jgi:hypothetical protein
MPNFVRVKLKASGRHGQFQMILVLALVVFSFLQLVVEQLHKLREVLGQHH